MKSLNLSITLPALQCPLYAINLRKNSYEIFKKNTKQTQFFPDFNLKMKILQKNKPNSNPIQSQYKPNFGPKTGINYENKPKQTQFPKSKNERFFAERELYFCFYNFTRETYHPKGCQLERNTNNI
jgi:hypothetical protein